MAQKARPGNNGLDPELVEKFVKQVEEVDAEIATIKSKMMTECKAKLGDRKEIINEAGEKGINKKALKAAVKQRSLERAARKVADGLDLDEQSQLEMIRHALGDLADLPLGMAAAANVNGTAEAHA